MHGIKAPKNPLKSGIKREGNHAQIRTAVRARRQTGHSSKDNEHEEPLESTKDKDTSGQKRKWQDLEIQQPEIRTTFPRALGPVLYQRFREKIPSRLSNVSS